MIVWLNGTFGVGKTTTAALITEARDGWRVFDPEEVGYMLQSGLSDIEVDDFQDLRPWRTLVPRVLRDLEDFTGVDLVAPQTVLSSDYWNELSNGFATEGLDVFHVVLDCDDEVLRNRILGDRAEADAQPWRLDHLERFAAARSWLHRAADLVVDTTTSTPTDVAAAILAGALKRELGGHSNGDTHRLGYRQVDDDANSDVLVDTMDATSRWPATRWLRAWERDQLRLVDGDRLLDVGCGRAEAALELAEDLSPGGEIVGIDQSADMLRVADANAHTAPCSVRFEIGDACALDEQDGSFDAVRCERTLQWIHEPLTAASELARVVRSGGLVSLIDTDWSTLTIDVGDDDLTARVSRAMSIERHRPAHIGSRLGALAEAAGLTVLAETQQTHTWTTWDPDQSPAPDGCFSMESLADDVIGAGQLTASDRTSFVATIHAAARDGRFSMSLTMFAVIASAP